MSGEFSVNLYAWKRVRTSMSCTVLSIFLSRMLLKPICLQSGHEDDIWSQRDRHDVQKWFPQQSVSCGSRRTREQIGHTNAESVSLTREQRRPASVSAEARRASIGWVGAVDVPDIILLLLFFCWSLRSPIHTRPACACANVCDTQSVRRSRVMMK